MIPHYVAASLVAENKVLCHPASVDSIPTSAGQEDHVSMGATAAVHCWRCARTSSGCWPWSCCAALRGWTSWSRFAPAPGSQRCRRRSARCRRILGDDRSLSAEIETVAELVADGTLVAAAEAAGPRLR
jgi:histidine ammonia-lyase